MQEAKSKLELLNEKQAKLQEEFKAAVAERKKKIADMAEKFKILDKSDAFFSGVFLDALNKAKEDKNHIKNLEALGSSFLGTKRKKLKEPA